MSLCCRSFLLAAVVGLGLAACAGAAPVSIDYRYDSTGGADLPSGSFPDNTHDANLGNFSGGDLDDDDLSATTHDHATDTSTVGVQATSAVIPAPRIIAAAGSAYAFDALSVYYWRNIDIGIHPPATLDVSFSQDNVVWSAVSTLSAFTATPDDIVLQTTFTLTGLPGANNASYVKMEFFHDPVSSQWFFPVEIDLDGTSLAIPEPGMALLLALSGLGLCLRRRRT